MKRIQLAAFNLTAELLADQMAMSRSSLFRQLKRLTGLLPCSMWMKRVSRKPVCFWKLRSLLRSGSRLCGRLQTGKEFFPKLQEAVRKAAL